ncbi:MAG: hypothetical protein JXB32_06170 [Deltaproteobacteria bacterium]|nr:hypothetical protein [Deltaproteobacteria bacterium]
MRSAPRNNRPAWLVVALLPALLADCKKDKAEPAAPGSPTTAPSSGTPVTADSGAGPDARAATGADDEFAAAPCWNGTDWVARDAVGKPSGAADRCGRVGDRPFGETPLELLGGRLTVRGPQGSRLLARPADAVATPGTVEKETRVSWEEGNERFDLTAWELFRSAGERPTSRVRAEVELRNAGSDIAWCVEPLPRAAGGLRAYALVPDRLSGDGSSLPVLSVLAVHPDGLVQELRWFVGPAQVSDAAGCIALARRAAATLATGPRRIPREAGAQRLDAFSQTKQLEVLLPADYVHTPQPDGDIAVHRIEPILPLGEPGASLSLYLGDNPAQPAEGWGGSIDRSKAPLLGEEVEWLAWFIPENEGKPAEFHLEALRPLPDEMGFPHFLHVLITAGDAGLRDELRDAARSLRIVDHSER